MDSEGTKYSSVEDEEAFFDGARHYEEFIAATYGASLPTRVELLTPDEGKGDEDDPLGFMNSSFYQPPYEHDDAYNDGWRSVGDRI